LVLVVVRREMVVGRRVERWRCRKEGLVVGFWMRARERAEVWRWEERRLLMRGMWVCRVWYCGVDVRRAVDCFEREGRESCVVRRIISPITSGGRTFCEVA
jgi:hypothetical protein